MAIDSVLVLTEDEDIITLLTGYLPPSSGKPNDVLDLATELTGRWVLFVCPVPAPPRQDKLIYKHNLYKLSLVFD